MSHRSFLGLAALEANRQGAFGKVWGETEQETSVKRRDDRRTWLIIYLLEFSYGYVIQGHVSVSFSLEWCGVNFPVFDSLALWFRLLVGPERHSSP